MAASTPEYNSYSLALPMIGGGFNDLSPRPKSLTVVNAVVNGGVTLFSQNTGSFNGSTTWLTTPSNAEFVFGTGDFFVRVWVYSAAATGGGVNSDKLLFGSFSSTPNMAFFLTNDALKPAFWDGTTQRTSSISVPANTWTQVEFTRRSGVFSIFVGGSVGYSASHSVNFTAGGTYYIGGHAGSNTRYLSGRLKDLVVAKGVGHSAPRVTDGPLTYVRFPDYSTAAISVGNTVSVAGNGPGDYVAIIDATTKELVRLADPDVDGNWTASVPAGEYYALYFGDGCQPICHGPYTLTAA